jgi:polyhydroxybutyrate depolymerase
MSNKVDDVEFTRRLLDDIARDVRIDPKRVYATGMSNGAIMSYRLASELSDRIAAIAPVSGPMGTPTCKPSRPVPVIHFHGTDDENAPFKGGKGKGHPEPIFIPSITPSRHGSAPMAVRANRPW